MKRSHIQNSRAHTHRFHADIAIFVGNGGNGGNNRRNPPLFALPPPFPLVATVATLVRRATVAVPVVTGDALRVSNQ